MFKKLARWILRSEYSDRPSNVVEIPKQKKQGFFNSAQGRAIPNPQDASKTLKEKSILRGLKATNPVDENGKPLPAGDSTKSNGFGMDAFNSMATAFDDFTMPQVSETVSTWFGAQSFIGHQMCAILAQQWLINKACVMPANDAIRKGWEITLNDDSSLTPEQLDDIRELDKKFKVNENLAEYIQFSRVFGIRICLFLVDSDDQKYYEKPFNIDGVGEGKYKGMTQVDPYWLAPELDMAASADPTNKNFYEPTWWRMSGLRIHRSHLCVVVPNPVADVLKPTYFFGGVPLTQQIYERVYNAERCATEAPQLLMTKRANVITMDIDKAISDPAGFEQIMNAWTLYWNNYGIKAIGEEETFQQHDTSLTDLDTTILTQFELVAAIAGVPSSKLLGQAPSGSLNATGDYEQASYHEMLESIQSDDLTPLLDRHYMLLAKSALAKKWPELTDKHFIINWNELNSMTEEQRADVNQKKAQTDETLINAGIITNEMAHNRIVKDPDSGHFGAVGDLPDMDDLEDDDDTDGNEKDGDEDSLDTVESKKPKDSE